MAYSGLLTTVNLYKMEKAQLTSELSDILMSITNVSRQSSQMIYGMSQEKSLVKEDYENALKNANGNQAGIDDAETQYELAMDEIENEYEFQIERINAWERELEMEKQQKETQIQMTGSYLDSFSEALKNNIKKDFTYGQNK